MSFEIDYSTYTLSELQEAYSTIDKNAYPDRANEIMSRIQALLSDESNLETNKETRISDSNIASRDKVKFNGNGTEYFAIWIVNILLTILTLGIYSAWATVRTNRYFFSNTEIGSHRLNYLAKPIQILKGRIIAVLLLATYLVMASFYPVGGFVVLLIIFACMPYIVCFSMRFKMRMMSYRNIRFGFKMRFGRAFVVFVLFPILGIISLYLAFPWVMKKIDEFLYENMTYGDRTFIPKLSTGEYYAATLLSGLIGFISIVFSGIVFGIVAYAVNSIGIENSEVLGGVFAIVGMAFYLLGLLVASSFYTAYIRNHVYNNTRVEGVAVFESEVLTFPLAKLVLTNYFLLFLSLGLAYPWVMVRKAHFFANATTIVVLNDINNVIGANNADANATADEVVGAFDIDLSIG